MTTRANPHLKSLPNPPRHRRTSPDQMSDGAPKVVAEGVPVAVRPDQQTGDGRYPIAWLTISAPAARPRPRPASVSAAATSSPPATARPWP